MGKHKNATKGGSDTQRGISPILSFHAGEAGDMGDVGHNLRDEVALLEDILSEMGASSKMPFCFVWCSKSPCQKIFITWALTK